VFGLRGRIYGRGLLCLVAVMTAISLILPTAYAQTEAPATESMQPLAPPAGVTAKAVYVEDATAGTALYSLNQDERRSPASTTKLMTALVIANNTTDWQELVTADASDILTAEDGESFMGLLEGDVLTVEQLMYGIMMPSGNDGAHAMARLVGGKLLAAEGATGDPVERFVQEMNATAANLGLQNTHFTNVSGLYGEDHYTSARDMAVIASEAFAVPQIAVASSVPTYTFTTQGANPREMTLQNTNKMLGTDGVIGGKTGTLVESGACLVVLLDQGGGNMVIGVVLGSEIEFDADQVQIAETDQRFNDMSAIVGAMTQDFRWVQPGDADFPGLSQELAVWNVRLGDEHALVLPTANAESLRYLLQLGPPAQPDTPVGKLLIFSGDRIVAERQVVQAGSA
jgi:D-alanyl-D-alanine carboxypeptidase (penicillin-binding protein 5/6)